MKAVNVGFQGERILHSAIVKKFVRRANGELVPLTEGSTRPITETTRASSVSRGSLSTCPDGCPLLMLWTAPPPARECHEWGCC
jgi:hypothetical protein